MSKKTLYIFLSVIFTLVAAILLIQLWFDVFDTEFLAKLFATIAIIVVLIGLVVLLRGDLVEESEQKKDKFIN